MAEADVVWFGYDAQHSSDGKMWVEAAAAAAGPPRRKTRIGRKANLQKQAKQKSLC